MTLYSIISQEKAGINAVDRSLEAACIARGITYKRIHPETTVLDDLIGQTFDADSLLYRISTGNKAGIVERFLKELHPETFTTLHYPMVIRHPRRNYRELIEQIRRGLQMIPTKLVDETSLTMNESELQRRYVEPLGGFPLIIKSLGKSHGQGVVKVDTMSELQRHLQEIDYAAFSVIARKYLADYQNYRVIVIDGKVAAVIEYHKPADDFRTNANDHPIVTTVDLDSLDPAVAQLAIDAVNIRGSILGGVDILIEQPSGIPMLAEANAPCNFARAEEYTGLDLSGMLIDALLRKQKDPRDA